MRLQEDTGLQTHTAQGPWGSRESPGLQRAWEPRSPAGGWGGDPVGLRGVPRLGPLGLATYVTLSGVHTMPHMGPMCLCPCGWRGPQGSRELIPWALPTQGPRARQVPGLPVRSGTFWVRYPSAFPTSWVAPRCGDSVSLSWEPHFGISGPSSTCSAHEVTFEATA